MKPTALRRFPVLMGVLALVLAACGGDGDNGGDAAGGAGALADVSLEGIEISVGSKDFTEQLVLGQMMVTVFDALGADVTDRVNLGGTNVARQAMLSGEIDTYMEYNGTGYSVHLAIEGEVPDDPTTLTEAVRERELAENEIQLARAVAVQQHLRVRLESRADRSQRWCIHDADDGGLHGRQPRLDHVSRV
jgi:osmoprotectant transport system substrate-binding protein